MTLRNETNGFFAQGRFFNAKGLSHFGGCGTRGICSHKYPSNILAVPVLSLRSTGIPKMLKLLWLKSSFAQKPLVSLHNAILKFLLILQYVMENTPHYLRMTRNL